MILERSTIVVYLIASTSCFGDRYFQAPHAKGADDVAVCIQFGNISNSDREFDWRGGSCDRNNRI